MFFLILDVKKNATLQVLRSPYQQKAWSVSKFVFRKSCAAAAQWVVLQVRAKPADAASAKCIVCLQPFHIYIGLLTEKNLSKKIEGLTVGFDLWKTLSRAHHVPQCLPTDVTCCLQTYLSTYLQTIKLLLSSIWCWCREIVEYIWQCGIILSTTKWLTSFQLYAFSSVSSVYCMHNSKAVVILLGSVLIYLQYVSKARWYLITFFFYSQLPMRETATYPRKHVNLLISLLSTFYCFCNVVPLSVAETR